MAAVVVFSSSGCRRKADSAGQPAAGVQAGPNGAKPVAEVAGAEWRMPAGDFGNLRYSTLDSINPSNAKDLRVVTTFSTGIPHGHEGQPLVIGGTMYVVTPFPNNLIAVDLSKPGGSIKWIYEPHPDPRAVGIACCDVVNRGPAYGEGLIIYSLLDATVVGVDAETGQERWRTKVGNINIGETFTAAPLVVHDKVIVGNSGGELGVRGYATALDVKTGKVIWKGYSTGPDSDVLIGPRFKPFYEKDRGANLGVTSWPPEQWKLGGGTVWGWISYDPETNLIFYGTGNPGVWNPDLRPGDNKWSCAILARDADTGELRWAYQATANDAWDYDEIMENVLVDMNFGGRFRKLLIHPGRTGFVYVLDRESGELLSATQYEPTNWASSYDLKTGRPVEDPSKRTHEGQLSAASVPHRPERRISFRLRFHHAPAFSTSPPTTPAWTTRRRRRTTSPALRTLAPASGCTQAPAVIRASSWRGIRLARRKSGLSRIPSSPCTAACSPRPGTLCFTERWTAGSKRWTHAREPSCGSSTPPRGSSAIRSPTEARTANSTSPSIPASVDGWERSRSRTSLLTIPRLPWALLAR